jgi:hypothetical protein
MILRVLALLSTESIPGSVLDDVSLSMRAWHRGRVQFIRHVRRPAIVSRTSSTFKALLERLEKIL